MPVRGLPTGLGHVEPDGAGKHIGSVEPSPDAVGGDTALIVASLSCRFKELFGWAKRSCELPRFGTPLAKRVA